MGAPNSNNLFLTRSRTATLNLAITQSGAAYNLTGASLRMTAKYNYSDPDGSAVFSLSTLGGGITVTNAPGGLATATISPAHTSSLPPAETPLFYDIQVTDASGNVFSVAQGTLYVYPNVTITTP